jgi:3'-phosphoadenosine 5'-phosphosulfate (PAPS) 3'-phosphatase
MAGLAALLRPLPETFWTGPSAFTPKPAALLLGDCDVAVHLPVDTRTTFVWDYAAAAILLVEAGGLFASWSGVDFISELPHVRRG